MNAEQIISKTLDGWFFRMDAEGGKVRATRVAHDFIPSHRPQGLASMADGSCKNNNGQAFPWTPEQDGQIVKMRAQGMPWRIIGETMGCSSKTVLWRHAKLTNTEIE